MGRVWSVLPSGLAPSARYRNVFNQTARDMGYPHRAMRITASSRHLLYDPIGGVAASPAVKAKYGHTTRAEVLHNQQFRRDIEDIQIEVERRRTVQVDAGMTVFPIVRSGTYVHNKFADLNPAERKWLTIVAKPLYTAVHAIYGLQNRATSAAEFAFLSDAGTPPNDRFHMTRTRSAPFRSEPTTAFPKAEAFTEAVRWFPSKPTMGSDMWPHDMDRAEFEAVSRTYPGDDPIMRPHTRVTRATEAEYRRLHYDKNPLRDANGQQREWLFQYPNKKGWYRVVDMAFDDAMRPHFLEVVRILREHADIDVGGERLHAEFREYLLTLADGLENGDWSKILQKDLKQTKGGIFFTLFPHEGYWNCSTKFPIWMVIGIYDNEFPKMVEGQTYTIDQIGERVARQAQAAGLTGYTAPAPFNAEAMRENAAMIWVVMEAGFGDGFARHAGGSDVPKSTYVDAQGEPIQGHRNQIYLDTLETWVPITLSVAEKVFGAEVAAKVTFESFGRTTLMHEATHGAQLPQDEMTLSGQPSGASLGKWWGSLVEPHADAGADVEHFQLYRDGKIDKTTLEETIYGSVAYSMVRFVSRENAVHDGYLLEAPHMPGSTVYINWLYDQGALVLSDKPDRIFEIDLEAYETATNAFLDHFTQLNIAGDMTAYEAEFRRIISLMDVGLEARILATQGPAYTIIQRGQLDVPPDIRVWGLMEFLAAHRPQPEADPA